MAFTTSSTRYYTTDVYTDYGVYTNYGDTGQPSNRIEKKSTFHSKPLEQIVNAGVLKDNIVIFSHYKSPACKDNTMLYHTNIGAFYTDPIKKHQQAARADAYRYAVIIDALEYIPGMMAKANLIKEALVTLSRKYTQSYVIIIAKTPEMVNEFAKGNKYEETKSGFLIPKPAPFAGLYMKGIDAEELIVTAHFAGARLAEIDKDVKTDLTCIRVYPNHEK